MRRPLLRYLARLALALSLALAVAPLQAGPRPHEHGTMTLDLVVEAGTLSLTLHAPLDSLLGFERAPRNEAERRAAESAMARLRKPEALLAATPAASCVWAETTLRAPVLDGAIGSHRAEHAELEAEYRAQCAHPAKLQSLRVDLFDAFPRVRRIDTRFVGPRTQGARSLSPGSRVVTIAP